MNQRGSAIVISLGIIVMLGTLGSAMLMRGLTESQIGRRSVSLHSAFFFAEAATDQAIANLRVNITTDLPTATLSTGTYWAEVTPLGGSTYQVMAHGRNASEQRNLEVVVQQVPTSVFAYAMFGDQSVNVGGSATTDSYDSSLGPYDDDTAGHHGDIGTNATSDGAVSISGSIFVDGQVVVGPGVGDPESVVDGYDPAFVTGGTDPPSNTQDVVSASQASLMPGVVVPSELTCDDFTVTGSTTVTLTPGTYCYRNLTIQGNADLTASGEVTIYVTGELSAQGNSVIGVPDDPTQMLFLMSATAEATLEQIIQGNNTFYGGIYGPEATFNVQGNATIYGSIIARQVNVSGSAEIHYDTALSDSTNAPTGGNMVTLLTWRELDN